MTASARLLVAFISALLALLACSLLVSWHLMYVTSTPFSFHLIHFLTIAVGSAFALCCLLGVATVRVCRRFRREAEDTHSFELALERRVEERTRTLRKEIEDRLLVEHLNRGQKRVLEMLANPGDLTTTDILQSLAGTVASRNQGWECSIYLVERRGFLMNLAGSSEVNERLQHYFKSVGKDFLDTPECQAASSGEVHIMEHLVEVDVQWSRLLVNNGIFSVWSVPFSTNNSTRLAGVLTVYARSRSKPEPREMEMVESAARLAALVIEHQRIQEELLHNAYQDAVTGLPNRHAGEQALENALENAQQHNEALAVLWIDINRFKRINDQHGHETGDQVLRTIAERLRRNPLSQGTVARMGEDEFLVLVPGTADSLDPVEIARRFSAVIAKPIYCGPSRITVTPCIGACVYPQDGTCAQVLERNADFALDRAKSSGESFCVFSTAMSEEANETLEIEQALAVALEKNYLRLAYQPIYSQDGELAGFEALLRFHHPQLGNIPPPRFIPIAEETRLIVPIGNWVLKEACNQLQAWHEAGLPSVYLSVNITALQFARDDFSDTVANIITECNMAPKNLVLELTESVVMRDYEAVVRQMNLLRQCGIRIAMDDFGTGYSSLSYLHRIPVSMLKIDRSFVEKLTEPEGTRPIVEAVISMANYLGLDVIAEGVEIHEQQHILTSAGCHYFQGFLFARPMWPEDAEKCLAASRTMRFANPTGSSTEEGGYAVA